MDILYLLTKSPFLNRMMVDTMVSLGVAFASGVGTAFILGENNQLSQMLYFSRYGRSMLPPFRAMLADRPLVNEMQEFQMAWIRYFVYVASFKGVFIVGPAWTALIGLPFYVLLPAVLAGGAILYGLLIDPSGRIGQAYIAYRILESRLQQIRGIALSFLWQNISRAFIFCKMLATITAHYLRMGFRILPAPEAAVKGPHRYEKLVARTEIRLLSLSPQPFSKTVQCSIAHFPIDEAPSYEAISYTWGDDSRTHELVIDGHPYAIPYNTYAALYQRSFLVKWVWIDAVCINQADDVEKSSQILLMTKIYKQASRVVVFLGDRDDAHLVGDLLAELHQRLMWFDEEKLGESFFKEYLRRASSPSWLAFLNLLDHPWFERVWVLQEVAVAKTVHVVYGNAYLDWNTLVSVLRIFINDKGMEASILLYATENELESRTVSNAPAFASIMTTVNEILGKEEVFPLSLLLASTQELKATNPHDKVYALLGITDPKSHGSVTVDYSKDVKDLYRETASQMLEEGSIDLLLHRAGIGLPRNLKDLPSWVPDWSCPTFNQWAIRPGYNAAPITNQKYTSGPVQNSISLAAKLAGRITHLSTTMSVLPNSAGTFQDDEWQQIMLEWFTHVLSLVIDHVPDIYMNGQLREEVLWRTLIGDVAGTTHPAPAVYGEYFLAWRKVTAEMKEILECTQQDKIPMGLNSLEEFMEITWRQTAFKMACGPFILNRRVAITDDGYIGTVPAGTEIGDVVGVFFNTETPVVLREEGGLMDGLGMGYRLVGDCYVHGLMNGEMVHLNGEVQRIVLL